MTSVLRLVTFDVTNTLLQFRSSVGDVYSKAAKLHGFKSVLNKEIINNSFKKNFKSLLIEHPNFGAKTSLSSVNWWSLIVERTLKEAISSSSSKDNNATLGGLLSKAQMEDISEYLYKLYAEEDCWLVLPGATQLLEKLKSKGLSLGIISNFDERLTNVLKTNGLYNYFDFVLASYVEKIQKPDKSIYDLALKKTDYLGVILPNECIHIGDDLINDYKGAKNAGWNALLLTENTQKMLINCAVDEEDIVRNVADIEKKISNYNLKKSFNCNIP